MSGGVSFIIHVLLIFLGGLMIRESIVDFKKERYFSFGIDFMCALTACVLLIRILLMVTL